MSLLSGPRDGRPRRGWLLVVTVMVVTMLVAGCSAPRPPAREKVAVRFGEITAAISFMAHHVAKHKGFYEEEGIEAITKEYTNGPMAAMGFSQGEIDVLMAGANVVGQAAAEGAEMRLLMSVVKDNHPIVARKNVTTFKQLDGKKVGTPGTGTLQDTILFLRAKEEGITIRPVAAKITDLVVYFEKGEIDAFSGWEPVCAEAVLRLDAHYLEPFPFKGGEDCVLAMAPKFLQEKPEVAVRVLSAMLRGIQYWKAHRDEVIELLATKVFPKPNAVEIISLGQQQQTLDRPDIDIPSLKFAIEGSIEAGKIRRERVPDVDAFVKDLVDVSYLARAKEKVGWK